MRFLVSADEIGNIKEIYASRGVDTSKKDGKQPKLVQNFLQLGDQTNVRNRVVEFKQYGPNWLIASRLGGFVSIYDLASESTECTLLHTYLLPVDSSDMPVSLLTFEEHAFIMVAFESGILFVIHFKDDSFLTDPLSIKICDTEPKEEPPKNPKQYVRSWEKIDKGPTTLCSFVQNPYSPGVFALGGRNCDLSVIRLFGANKKFKESDFTSTKSWKPKVLFEAENVEPDHLGIECPIYISRILFQKEAPKKGFRLVTATRTGHIRKYDTIEDKEPVGSYKVCDKPILTMVFANETQDQIIVSDQHTFVLRLSLVEVDAKAQKIVSASAGTFYKPSLKLLGKFSEGGNTGAIRGVDVSLGSNIVAFGGLDRYLRVFDISTRKLLTKVYLGTQISSLEIMDDEDDEDEDSEAVSEEAKDEKEFWDKLEVVDDKVLKKRKIE